MIRACVTTHSIVRPLEPERDLPALLLNPSHLGLVSARWAQVYLTDTQRHEKGIRWNHATNRTAPRARDCPTALLALDHREGKG